MQQKNFTSPSKPQEGALRLGKYYHCTDQNSKLNQNIILKKFHVREPREEGLIKS